MLWRQSRNGLYAAMITIKSNIGQITAAIRAKLEKLTDKENIPRILAFDTIDLMTKRIHIDGKDSADAQIGTYSKGYMAVRTGNFKNSDKFSRGKNKGKNKNAGVVSKQRVATPFGKSSFAVQNIEADKKARVNYNRSNDTKVIISLTRQLENDWSVIATGKGYGVGFLNPHNLDKARWTEATYDKNIFSLSRSEENKLSEVVQELVNNVLK